MGHKTEGADMGGGYADETDEDEWARENFEN